MTGQFRAHLRCRWRHLRAEHVRIAYASLFEYCAIGEDPASTAAACFTLPVIGLKALLAIHFLECIDNALLQRPKILADLRD